MSFSGIISPNSGMTIYRHQLRPWHQFMVYDHVSLQGFSFSYAAFYYVGLGIHRLIIDVIRQPSVFINRSAATHITTTIIPNKLGALVLRCRFIYIITQLILFLLFPPRWRLWRHHNFIPSANLIIDTLFGANTGQMVPPEPLRD